MLFGITRWVLLHIHCCWVCLVFYSFPQRTFMPGCHSCLSRKGFPNLLLSFISSHINRKTQYENPVLEAKRKKQLEQQQQPPEGWHYRGRDGWGFHEGTCPPSPRQHHANVFILPSVALAFKSKMMCTGKVAYALHIRCSKGENLNRITT